MQRSHSFPRIRRDYVPCSPADRAADAGHRTAVARLAQRVDRAASAAYLVASALWLGSRRPLWWVIGAVLAFAFASVASDVASSQLGMVLLYRAPERALTWLLENPYGVDAVLTARTATLDTGMSFPNGERVAIWSAMPEMAHWLKATLLWTGAGLVALWAAVSRHREQRRA